jgi:hypothetical protein
MVSVWAGPQMRQVQVQISGLSSTNQGNSSGSFDMLNGLLVISSGLCDEKQCC